jgi:hypothetical protein
VPGSTVPHNPERSLSGILASGAQRKVIQNSDPSHQGTKIKDVTGFRQGASSSRCCHRYNEVGHSTQICAVDKLRVSAVKSLSERNMKDVSAKRIRTSETSTSEAVDNSCNMPSDRRDESAQALSSGDEPMTSTVPELDWIWQYEYSLLSIPSVEFINLTIFKY